MTFLSHILHTVEVLFDAPNNRIEKRIVLIDGKQLAEFMIDHNVGVTQSHVYEIKRVDIDYFNQA